MINAPQLLNDLKRRLNTLEADLRDRISEVPDLKSALQAEWQAARAADRTAETFDSWADQVITQAGVHWLLSCVFLRFIEDNTLVERPWISGTPASGRLELARDRHEAYFRAHPLESDREYLLACFMEAGALPGLHTFFDQAHNPVFRLGISGDAAMALRQFWQQQDPNSGALLHDFTDATWNTRFLGDLYQDLSEATRKRYALLQTPEFVEEFILDRTLTPAIREFGYRAVRMIDPTCGSGHFLLGGFQRIVDEWSRAEPTRNPRDVAQKALDSVAGIDLNPFAVAISRFRLLVAALQTSDVRSLSDAPDFHINVAIGDSLLHGQRFGLSGQSGIQTDDLFDAGASHANTGLSHAYASEDLGDVQRILGRQYHAVVGNPPYIVVKDGALNAAYRKKYASCHMKYSLGAPFTERFFELAMTQNENRSAGFVGLITANSFMKREFGSKLIEQVLPRLDLTHVIDTAGAYIPGHGIPTVILFGRHRPPVENVVRTVMGIKGEPSTPAAPAQGLVWSAIVKQIDIAGSEGLYVSATDTSRTVFGKHPWSIGGGGAADLKELIESGSTESLRTQTTAMGFFGISAADEVMVSDAASFRRRRVESDWIRPLISGDEIRDWTVPAGMHVMFPYTEKGLRPIAESTYAHRWLWPSRSYLGARVTFSKRTYLEEGRPWWEWHQIALDRIRIPLTISLAEIATHNHFVLDRGGKVFNRTAPIIKLRAGATEDEHFGLLGLLNSSVACFWLKQVCFPKGGDHVGGEGARVRKTMWDERYAFNATNVAEFPLVANHPIDLTIQLDELAGQLAELLPSSQFIENRVATDIQHTAADLGDARANAAKARRQMVCVQEELDWRCYQIYGLLPVDIDELKFSSTTTIEVAPGERAFEIVLARLMATGIEQTTWFERHGSTPITEIPCHWPESYRTVVQRRIDLIARDRNIGLIERPEYKRRWASPSWAVLENAALRDWLLGRLELPMYWKKGDVPPQLNSTSGLADSARQDSAFMHVAALFAGHPDFDLERLVADLVTSEAAPFLPRLRYADSGLRKRAQWEETWDIQRREDAGDIVGNISIPPKYQSKDFLKTDVWRLRGPLDVPKERWISYPGCERGADSSLVIAWAGWTYLEQATAIASFYIDMKDNEGWQPERLQPLLAGLHDLLPWLQQWHNELDPAYGERMGDYYSGFVLEEARALGFTQDDLRAWKPKATAAKRGRKAKA